MTPKSEWPCWKIMKCINSEGCEAKKHPDKNCWEIAGKKDDYRRALNVCRDCVVYLLKTDSSILSDEEIISIMDKKGECPLK